MPMLGMGLHVLIALFFGVHAIRNHQPLFWLFVLFSFPLLGSIVYFLAIYLPSSRLERGARKTLNAALQTLDPGKELRAARQAFEYTPTAQNQLRLAAALLEMNQAEEAATLYAGCLKGPFATDLDIRLSAARACFASGKFDESITHLTFIRQTDPEFRPEPVTLLMAKTQAALGQNAAARTEFETALARFGSFETRAEYAIWAFSTGDTATAGKLSIEIEQAMRRWNRHTREMNKALIARLNAVQQH